MITLIFDFDVFDSCIFVFDYDTYSILILFCINEEAVQYRNPKFLNPNVDQADVTHLSKIESWPSIVSFQPMIIEKSF